MAMSAPPKVWDPDLGRYVVQLFKEERGGNPASLLRGGRQRDTPVVRHRKLRWDEKLVIRFQGFQAFMVANASTILIFQARLFLVILTPSVVYYSRDQDSVISFLFITLTGAFYLVAIATRAIVDEEYATMIGV